MSNKKKTKLSIKRRSFLTNTIKVGVFSAAAVSGFPYVWFKQGNAYAAKNEIKVGSHHIFTH